MMMMMMMMMMMIMMTMMMMMTDLEDAVLEDVGEEVDQPLLLLQPQAQQAVEVQPHSQHALARLGARAQDGHRTLVHVQPHLPQPDLGGLQPGAKK
jgi:hypothetical protein